MSPSVCDRLWKSAHEVLVPQISAWGFDIVDSRNPGSGQRLQDFSTSSSDLRVLLRLWVDCKRLCIVLDGAFVNGRNWNGPSDEGPISVHDIRLRKTFRLVRSYFYFFIQGDISYRLRQGKGSSEEIDNLTADVLKDMKYLRDYIFSGYRGRRIVEG